MGHYADFPNDPMTLQERQQVTRMMSDPLNFPEEFTNWLDRRNRAAMADYIRTMSFPGTFASTGDYNTCTGTVPPQGEWSYQWGQGSTWAQSYVASTTLIGTTIASPYTGEENPVPAEHAFPPPTWNLVPPRASNYQYWVNQGWTLWAKCATVLTSSTFAVVASLVAAKHPEIPNQEGVAINQWFGANAVTGLTSLGADWTVIAYTGVPPSPCVDLFFMLALSANSFTNTMTLAPGTLTFQWRPT